MIRRHRSRMLPGGYGYSDNPTFGGFESKSPCSDHAMELGDLEAAFVGNLARYCIAAGSLPFIKLKGFWWVNGVCRGLSGQGMDEDEFTLDGELNGYNYLSNVQKVIDHLKANASAVVETEGVEFLLSAGMDTRWYSLKMFPEEAGIEDQWLNEDEAISFTGRTKKTLDRWAKSGAITRLGERGDYIYSRIDLNQQMTIVRDNLLRRGQQLQKAKQNER